MRGIASFVDTGVSSIKGAGIDDLFISLNSKAASLLYSVQTESGGTGDKQRQGGAW